jgi:hypothetical protein
VTVNTRDRFCVATITKRKGSPFGNPFHAALELLLLTQKEFAPHSWLSFSPLTLYLNLEWPRPKTTQADHSSCARRSAFAAGNVDPRRHHFVAMGLVGKVGFEPTRVASAAFEAAASAVPPLPRIATANSPGGGARPPGPLRRRRFAAAPGQFGRRRGASPTARPASALG